MSVLHSFSLGQGAGKRQSHVPPIPTVAAQFPVQATQFQDPHFPFQPLPPPNAPAPYRFDLSQLLSASDIATIKGAASMVLHTVGDTGDYRGQEQDFVAAMMTQDAEGLPGNKKPTFYYHLGDVSVTQHR